MKALPFVLLLGLALSGRAELPLAESGKTRHVIVVDAAAAPAELLAARELAASLKEITGAEFKVQTNTTAPARAILVGPGTAARRLFREVPFDRLGPEELVMETKGRRLLLAGGRPRGTLYAVSRFLQEQGGVRWWTPWAKRMPSRPDLRVPDLHRRDQPAFEYRQPYWHTAFDPDWSWRNGCNGHGSQLTTNDGGSIIYRGFVHTFYSLVPPEKHFAEHPEWFSLIKGQRTASQAQLCLTNPKLREFLLSQVRQWLRESPEAGIISVSQNDWYGACQCDACRSLNEAEGSYAGSMLAFVNAVAESIAPEFPQVAVDTLAYQYTRPPPKTIHARSNVIVRLCSIEANVREPLEHPSNAGFAADLRGWSERSDRLYVWDYTTDFSHYVQPHPNWFVLGPNLRFFQRHHVRGVFEQGAYQSHGSEMAELRSWVLAQLLWNPHRDDRALIREFLDGYYGAAAPAIGRYLELMHDASQGYYLNCSSPPDAPHLRFKPLSEAERLWQEATRAAAGNEELLARVRLAHLPVRYVWLARWDALRKEGTDAGAPWRLPEDRSQVADEWLAVARGSANRPWTVITKLNEGGLTPEKWVERVKRSAGK